MQDGSSLIGIDHGFSFPLAYFQKHGLLLDWPLFLDGFQVHWPTNEEGVYVDFVRDGICGTGIKRSGSPRWRRITEVRARAKSVFHFDVPGSVAKSTHAGIPWLRYLRSRVNNRVHFWPFDGWAIPASCSVVTEVYRVQCILAVWTNRHDIRTPEQFSSNTKYIYSTVRNVGNYRRE
jgi:hypothetical protein